MRSYIFTARELEALEQFLKTKRRNPTVNKLVHYVRHNQRLIIEVQLLLELIRLAHKPRIRRPKMPPGRPPKMLKGLV